jgi:hypothetical protein
MASDQRGRPNDGPATARSRARSRPKHAQTPRSSGCSSSPDQEPDEPAGNAASELVPAPRTTSPDLAGESAPDELSTPEAPPKNVFDFLWRTSRDEKAQKGLCRLIWTVGIAIIWPIALIAFMTMPAASLAAKIGAVITSAITVAVGATFTHKRKHRGGPPTEPPADGGPSTGLATRPLARQAI